MSNVQKRHIPSGHGKGKWEHQRALDGYRRKRNAKRKDAKRRK